MALLMLPWEMTMKFDRVGSCGLGRVQSGCNLAGWNGVVRRKTMAPFIQTEVGELKGNELGKPELGRVRGDKMTWRWVEHKLRATGLGGRGDKWDGAKAAVSGDVSGAR